MASTLEQPKKAPSGYWLYLTDVREEIVKSLGTAKGSAVSKKCGEMWKELGEEKKKPYEEKAAKLKAEYNEALKNFKEDGGVVTRKSKKNKEEKTKKDPKDPNAPKKPTGGGYGVYLAENREKITKSLPADHKMTDVAKAAGEQWKALADDLKAKYTEQFQAKSEEYRKAYEEYKANLPEEEEPAESPSPAKKGAAKKRAAEDSADKQPRAKKAKADKKASYKDPTSDIAPEILAEASKLGYESALKNLVSRVEIEALSLPADQMLAELKKHDGLVNPTKRALLAGASGALLAGA